MELVTISFFFAERAKNAHSSQNGQRNSQIAINCVMTTFQTFKNITG